jgi:hypothetical protein
MLAAVGTLVLNHLLLLTQSIAKLLLLLYR